MHCKKISILHKIYLIAFKTTWEKKNIPMSLNYLEANIFKTHFKNCPIHPSLYF